MGVHSVVITVLGEFDERLRDEFDDVEVVVEAGVTRLRLSGADSALLHGLLRRIHALDLSLLDVRSDQADRDGSPDLG